MKLEPYPSATANRKPDMAKIYMLLHQEQQGFFELRERKAAA